MNRSLRRILPLALLILWSAAASAQPAGPQQQVTLEHADEFRGRMENGEQVIEAIGNVRGRQGSTEISANRAIHYPARNQAVLIGSVRVVQPGIVLTAPRAEYDGNARIAVASDGVRIVEGDATIEARNATFNLYNRVASFSGGVTLQDAEARVEAASGDYYSSERRAEFRGNVRVVSDSGTVTAREITYWRDTEEMTAVGSVVVIPRDRNARLSGDRLRHVPAIGYTLVSGAARLVDVDTAASGDLDTTIITAARMEAYRTEARQEYIATDTVVLTRGKLQAMTHAAYYIPDDDVIALGSGQPRRTAAPAPVDTAAVTGRTPADTTGGDPSAGGSTPSSSPERFLSGLYPVVWYDASQLSGDTITVRLRDKELRSIEVDGDAMAVNSTDFPDRYDQLAGERVVFNVAQDTIRQIRADGSASIISFIKEDARPNGVARNSGERIDIHFAHGDPKRIVISRVAGRLRNEGETFPESMVQGSEGTYRLQGFRWVPRPEGR